MAASARKLLPFIQVVLPTLLILLGFVSFSIFKNRSETKLNQSLPQDPNIKVYFNHNGASEYEDPYRQINRPGDDLEQILIDTINSAKSTIDVAVQEIRLPNLAKALVKRHQQGIKVRVILENNYNHPIDELNQINTDRLNEYEQSRHQDLFTLVDIDKNYQLSAEEVKQRDAIAILQSAGIPMIDDTADGFKGSGLMHHKFIIVDDSTLIVSSANFTLSDIHGDYTNPESRGNANHLLKIKTPQLAKIFTQEFNLMWGDGVGKKLDSKFGTGKPYREPYKISIKQNQITVQFSPTSETSPWNLSSNGLISQFLNQANRSIDLALFVFSEQKLANILEGKQQQDKSIKVLIDPTFAFRSYSEGLDMLGVALSDRCKYESDNHPWQKPINTVGIPSLPQGDKLHHKFAVIDNSIVITGSHNWSKAANNTNDETLMIVKNSVVAAHFDREFQRLYQQASLGIPKYIQEQIAKDRSGCPHTPTTASLSPTNGLVNLNTASQSQLENLPGIGESTAQQIIAARQQKPFTSLQDLDKVTGIGSSTLKKLEGKVTW